MRISKVAIDCFASIGHIEYELTGKGLVVVEGENKDSNSANSNGSGKSTAFVDAIFWCFYGITVKGTNADSVLPDGKGKGTRVSVDLVLDDGRTVSISRHRKHPVGSSSVFLVVDGVDKTKSTNPETDKDIEALLGVDKQTFLHTTLFGQGMTARFSQLTDAGRKELMERIIESEVYDSARKLARSRAAQLTTDQTQISTAIQSAQARLQFVTNSIADISRNICAAEAQEATRVEGIANDIADAQAKVVQAEATYAEALKIPSSSDKLDVLEKAEGTAYNAWQKHVGIVSDKTAELKQATSYVSSLHALKDGAPCFSCGREMTEEHRRVEHKKRSEAIPKLEADLADATVNAEGAWKRHNNILKSITDTRRRVGQERSQLDFAANEVRSARVRLDTLQKMLNQPPVAIDGLKSTLQKHEEELRVCADSLKSHETALADSNAKIAYYTWWVDGFQAIRVKVIDSALAYLNFRIDHYCKVLTDGTIKAVIEHDDKGRMNVIVSTRGGTYASASGGEKDRVDIAIAFALHDLVSQRTSFRCNVLVMDEICGFLDSTGIDRLMTLVSEKLDRVETVLLVSHNPVFRSYGETVWTVVKEGGVSRLESA